MSRRSACLQLDDGQSTKISRKIAFQLIDVGELVLVKRRPFTVKIPKHKEFHEEQRHLSGRRIPGVSKGLFNGRHSISGGLRFRVPRSAQSKGYVMTIGWVRQARRLMIEDEEKKKAKDERDKRNKAKRKRRRMRRRQMRQTVQVIVFLVFTGFAQAQIRSECPDQSKACTPLWWDTNPEPDVDRYFIFRSDVTCSNPVPEPSTCPTFSKISPAIPQGPSLTTPRFIDENVEFDRAYYYAATAANTSDLESVFSVEREVFWVGLGRPSAPGGFRGEELSADLRLDWDDNPVMERVNVYNIFKSSSDDVMGNVVALVTISEYQDVNPNEVGPKFYWVRAVNDFGMESIPSGPVIYRGK